MADDAAEPTTFDEPEETPGYVAPAKKSIEEIEAMDNDDESLVKYKQTLLAGIEAKGPEGDPRRVVVKKMVFCTEGHDMEFDLTGDVSKFKDNAIVVKEGIDYKIKIEFRIQHEIISGLRYSHVVSRKGMTVDKMRHMVGSYAPKNEDYAFTSPSDEAPSGMIARGHYKIKSKFTDDDQNVHLAWEWAMDIKKDWK